MNKIKKCVFCFLAVMLVLEIVSMGMAESADWPQILNLKRNKNGGNSRNLVDLGNTLIDYGNKLIEIGNELVNLGKMGTYATSIGGDTSEEAETPAKTAAAKLNQLKDKNGGNLNGLVEIAPILPEIYRNELIPQGETVWEKSGSDLFVSSEAIKLEPSKPYSCVNEDDFITEFAMWLGQNAPISRLLIDEREVSWEVNDIPQLQREFIESVKLKAIELIEANEAGYGESDVNEKDLQEKLAAHLQAKIDSDDSFYYAFVLKETEALYKIFIDDKPRDGYTQFIKRYYLKPDWLPVNQGKIDKFVDDHVRGARVPTRVEIFYENKFSLNENSPHDMVYEKFAEQMLYYAGDN